MKIEISTHNGWLVLDNNNIKDKKSVHISIRRPPERTVYMPKEENIMFLTYVPLDELIKALELLKELPSEKE